MAAEPAMVKRGIALFFILLLAAAAYPQQKIRDFYLANYKPDGGIDWEVRGDEAVIYDKYVDIDKMDATYYTSDDTILVKSKTAKLNKENMDIFLKDDVEIENQEGTKLITDSLDWQRSQNSLATEDWVEVNREDMQIRAQGLSADTQLKNVDFQKEVQLKLPEEDKSGATIITCDGPLEIEYETGMAVFQDNVVVEHSEGTLSSDKTTVFFDSESSVIIKIVSEGNVKIVKDKNETYAQKATYLKAEGRVVLEGRPRVIYFPQEKDTHETAGDS